MRQIGRDEIDGRRLPHVGITVHVASSRTLPASNLRSNPTQHRDSSRLAWPAPPAEAVGDRALYLLLAAVLAATRAGLVVRSRPKTRP